MRAVRPLLVEIRRRPLLWLLAFVPAVFLGERFAPERHTLLFVLSILAIVPLAALMSSATESLAVKAGDSVGGLLNATLGNLAEFIIALAALRSGQHTLVKASVAGTIVANTLFTLGASFLLGGMRHHQQQFNRQSARLQAGLLFFATMALLVPSAISQADSVPVVALGQELSVGLSVLLITAYGFGLLFSLRTHRQLFGSAAQTQGEGTPWPMGIALATIAGLTVVLAAVSHAFIESIHGASRHLGMTPVFAGFIVVALVGDAAEMATAVYGAWKNRLDLSVGIALGSAAQIALFVAPVLVLLSHFVGPSPMSLQFWPGAVIMMLISVITAFLVTDDGRAAWFPGMLVVMVYLIFAMTLYSLPPVAE